MILVFVLTAEYFFEEKVVTEEQLAFLRMLSSKYGNNVKASDLSLGETKKFVDIFANLLPEKKMGEKIQELFAGTFKLVKGGESTEFKLV